MDECAQKMKDIRLHVDKRKLKNAIDNIRIALRAMEMLRETNDVKVANRGMQDIARGTLNSDNEELTSDSDNDSNSDDESCNTCDSD